MSGNDQAVALQQTDWELSKENFQPLKAGRKPGGLNDPSAGLKKLTRDEQRKEFEKALVVYKGDDPLEVWLGFIKWTQETFKTGGHQAELLPLLERCTREFQGQQRYVNDVRYLRVWIQYADCLPDPTDVFAFLKEHGIGQGHALFYIAHASFLEVRGNYTAADNAYQQGINTLAVPTERLRAKFNDFQHRMARRIQRSAQEQSLGRLDSEVPGHPERQSLAVLGIRSGERSSGLASQKRKAVATPVKDNAPAGVSGLAVFVDEEFGGPVALGPTTLPSGNVGGRSGVAAWETLPSFDQMRKENHMQAAMWAGQRMKQKPSHHAPIAPALDIPIDPEFEALDAQNHAAPNGTLRQRLDRAGAPIDEKLANDPLQLYRGATSIPASSRGTALQKHIREELILCNVELLQDEIGQEQCFEEARARLWREKESSMKVLLATDLPTPFAEASLPLMQTSAHPSSSNPDKDKVAIDLQACSSDVTMATRGAFEAINAAFGHRFGDGRAADKTMDANMTMSTKAAYAAVDTMLNGRLGSGGGAGVHDVTMNTKAAFDALNAAFSSQGTTSLIQQKEGTGMTKIYPKVSEGSPAAIFIRQDTGLGEECGTVASTERHPATIATNFGGELSNRDDTTFTNIVNMSGRDDNGDSEGFSIREDTVFIKPSGRSIDSDFLVREDTVIITKGVFGDTQDTGGFSIREDTVFINPMAADDALQSGLDVRDDTVFINRPDAPVLDASPTPLRNTSGVLASKSGLAKRSALQTSGDAHPNASSRDRDVHLAVDDCKDCAIVHDQRPLVQQAHLDRRLQGSTALTTDMQEMLLQSANQHDEVSSRRCLDDENAIFVEHDENSIPPETQVPLAANPCSRRSPLQPADCDSGPNIEEDSEAEAALAAPLESKEEDFAIYCDDAESLSRSGGSEHNVVDPFAPSFHRHMLEMLEPNVAFWPGVETIDAGSEAAAMAGLPKKRGSVAVATKRLTLASREYDVHGIIGSGSYATVYGATNVSAASAEEEHQSDVAIKVETPPCPWEWYLCRVVAGRISTSVLQNFVQPSSLMLGPSASFMELPRGRFGSLQDLLNVYLARAERPDETVVARLTAQLLRLMGHLHTAKVLHNDIKPDNVLIIVQEGCCDDENAAPTIGMQLIDFGRGVDLELLPSGVVLSGDCDTDAFRCVEMRERQPWMWAADMYGVAGTVHCLLFGKYMEVERVVDGSTQQTCLRIKAPFKRYWNADLWSSLFENLLNAATLDASTTPPWTEMAEELEAWLLSSREVQRTEKAEMSKLFSLLDTVQKSNC